MLHAVEIVIAVGVGVAFGIWFTLTRIAKDVRYIAKDVALGAIIKRTEREQ